MISQKMLKLNHLLSKLRDPGTFSTVGPELSESAMMKDFYFATL